MNSDKINVSPHFEGIIFYEKVYLLTLDYILLVKKTIKCITMLDYVCKRLYNTKEENM